MKPQTQSKANYQQIPPETRLQADVGEGMSTIIISQKNNEPNRFKPLGEAPTDIRSKITYLYENAINGDALLSSLKNNGYVILRSTRNVIFVIDSKGGQHNLISIIGAPCDAINQKLSDIKIKDLPIKLTRNRNKVVKVSVTQAEKVKVENLANECKLSVSGFLRKLVFGKNAKLSKASRRPPLDIEELIKIRTQLRKIGHALNQIANEKNSGKSFDQTFSQLYSEHSRVLDAIMSTLGKRYDS